MVAKPFDAATKQLVEERPGDWLAYLGLTGSTQDATPVQARMLWTATYILMGLKFPADFTENLLKGAGQMKESVTYQVIVAEGRAEGRTEEARNLIRLLGGKRFGPPTAAVETSLAAIDSVERLESLAARILEVESWDELLS